MRAVLEREPKGPKCKHGDAYTIHTRGEGRFVYKPDLTNAKLTPRLFNVSIAS